MKNQRPDLIRQQPSLGDQLINIGVKEGVGLLGKLLDRGDKNKALAAIIEYVEQNNFVLRALNSSMPQIGEALSEITNHLKDIDNRLNEIEEKLTGGRG